METNSDDYLESFMAALRKNEKARKQLEDWLLEGINSPSIEADEDFWRQRRQKIYDKHPELQQEEQDSE